MFQKTMHHCMRVIAQRRRSSRAFVTLVFAELVGTPALQALTHAIESYLPPAYAPPWCVARRPTPAQHHAPAEDNADQWLREPRVATAEVRPSPHFTADVMTRVRAAQAQPALNLAGVVLSGDLSEPPLALYPAEDPPSALPRAISLICAALAFWGLVLLATTYWLVVTFPGMAMNVIGAFVGVAVSVLTGMHTLAQSMVTLSSNAALVAATTSVLFILVLGAWGYIARQVALVARGT